ncbi:methionyl-tRNA formyltransferase [Desulfurispirillum indicum]|uniref:Methionyl-tRNA formyltransferase n=1 Tax=Desulfurispirillum indicum (strain ATCC BAA-1389 / DSM 22839 / S5) TaxID=653733 RepID=E6W0N4_DESIS|nr:methionyl-tRNA formyltransferase [Desulfurispirillum indicum]ADU65286.1 methionyl-tRNA formyltransferase [Desulfurispirillum indicum S5]UCZ57183.1 methionyl-tRNA formyltransferase [Desulfurispirillum indicum]
MNTPSAKRVGFMGTPEFSVPALEALASVYEIPIVITQPDRPAGRTLQLTPSAVKTKALQLGIPVLTPARVRKNPQFLAQIADLNLDAIVVVAYGQILPQEFLDIPPFGCYNIHASLLPHFRGAAPIQRAILEGCPETGITIIRMDAGLDTGDMVLKKATPIDAMNAAQLHDHLAPLGAEAILEALAAVFQGTAQFTPQDHSQHTYAPKLRREEGILTWHEDAVTLERRIRAFTPWPGCRCRWRDKDVKILEAEPTQGSGAPGQVLSIDLQGIEIACRQGALRLKKVQPQGKRVIDAHAFANGYGVQVGNTFL